MGKQNQSQKKAAATKQQSKAPPMPDVQNTGAQEIAVTLPIGPAGNYVIRGFQRDLPPQQAAMCRRVINQLQADGVKLASGRAIERPEDVLCLIMERIERQLAAEPAQPENDNGSEQTHDTGDGANRTSAAGGAGGNAGAGSGATANDGNGGDTDGSERGHGDSSGAGGRSGSGDLPGDGNGVPELVGAVD